jgi:hypothetical protein
MADLSTKSFKDAPTSADVAKGNMSDGDARTIRMIAAIGDRRLGQVYVVDSSLAQHYCEVNKVAEYVTDAPKAETPSAPTTQPSDPDPAQINDRAMMPPPRGRRK